jgi:hypothetical protein
MTQLFNMEIGGMDLTIYGNESLHFQDSRPVYHPFVQERSNEKRSAGIDIFLEIQETMPKTTHLEQIFHSGNAWSMYRNDEGYCVSLDLPGYHEPIWLAKVNRDFTRARLFCGKELFTRDRDKVLVQNPLTYPLDQILLMYILAKRKGLLIHALGLISKERGYLFPGRSGAGKSTLALELERREGYELLSDDRLVIKKTGDVFNVYGTPWPGDAGISMNRNVELSAILFLEHGPFNRIEEIGRGEAVERLLSVVSVPWFDRDIIPHMLSSCEALTLQVPAYRLCFKPGREVKDLLDRFFKHEASLHKDVVQHTAEH